MKILMFGRGVISTLYGWALEACGHSVDFYVRKGRKAQIGNNVKLNIYDLRNENKYIDQIWDISLLEDLQPNHDYDLIFVSVTHYRFKEVVALLSSKVSNATIVIFNNFWEDPGIAASPLPITQLAWGFPGAAGGFQPTGELYGTIFPQITFGTLETDMTDREKVVRKVFENAGFKISEKHNFREWLWVHFAISASISAQRIIAGSGGNVYGNHAQAIESILNVREIIPLLSAKGVKTDDHTELTMFNQPASALADEFNQRYQNVAFKAAIDGHTNPNELKQMFLDVLEESHRLKIELPRLEGIYANNLHLLSNSE